MKSLKTICLILLLLLVSSACSASEPFEEEVTTLPPTVIVSIAEATATESSPTETAVPPTATNEPTAVPTESPPEPTATIQPTPFVVEMDNCQSCHSDKEMLIDTADPVVEQESSESSGVG